MTPKPPRTLPPQPTRTRMVVCAIVVFAFAVAVWWVVDFRSAPPPPPQVTIPR